MKSLNLSNIKRVGFIPNFNSKGSYPEFVIAEAKVSVVEAAVQPVSHTVKAVTADMAIRRMERASVKRAKKSFKQSISAGYKPKLIN